MFDCKQCLMPWQAGMPALVKVKGEFRICPTYRLITEKYTDIRRRMAEKEAAKASARREAVGFVPKFALYRKLRNLNDELEQELAIKDEIIRKQICMMSESENTRKEVTP